MKKKPAKKPTAKTTINGTEAPPDVKVTIKAAEKPSVRLVADKALCDLLRSYGAAKVRARQARAVRAHDEITAAEVWALESAIEVIAMLAHADRTDTMQKVLAVTERAYFEGRTAAAAEAAAAAAKGAP